MKIKVRNSSYAEVMAKPPFPRFSPQKPGLFFRTLTYLAGLPELKGTHFTCTRKGMEQLEKGQPCLYLMNHSCFIDLKIAAHILYPHPFQIVCTQDGFIGKLWLMKRLGCIPKKKFVPETAPIRDMLYAFRTLHTSVLMYPEASYSFDGTATPLPDSLGRCLKLLGVPVVMIRTHGAFLHDPLYNGLQQRKVNVSAEMEYLLSPQQIAQSTSEQLNAVLRQAFDVDDLRWQQENEVAVTEPFRADHLHRVLYKCPVCGSEEGMHGAGTHLTCRTCGHAWELDEYGRLNDLSGGSTFAHIPDWYAWERECVRRELDDGTYRLACAVDILMAVDYRSIYRVGNGTLTHDRQGFRLTGCDGQLSFSRSPLSSYSLYADHHWYELGDVICLSDEKRSYYCFPKDRSVAVAKARIATEELYKRAKAEQGTQKETVAAKSTEIGHPLRSQL